MTWTVNTDNVVTSHIFSASTGETVKFNGSNISSGYYYALSNDVKPTIPGLSYSSYASKSFLAQIYGQLSSGANDVYTLRTDFGQSSSYQGKCAYYLLVCNKTIVDTITLNQSNASQNFAINMEVGQCLIVDQTRYSIGSSIYYGVKQSSASGAHQVLSNATSSGCYLMAFIPTAPGTYVFENVYVQQGGSVITTGGKITVTVTGAPTTNIKVKVGETWKDGKAYVKVNGVWKESDSVWKKVNGVWKKNA